MLMRIAIVAGEPSGDVLAAGLIRALRSSYPDAYFYGIGGEQMQAEGFEAMFAMDSIALMGVESVLRDLRNILRIRKSIEKAVLDDRPDCFIGVDVPDFNITLERRLHERGIKVMHYVSPSVWAWRGYRIHKIKRAVDHILTLFPFEKTYYDRHGIAATFIGHPTADKAVLIRERADISRRQHTIALLPGSRGAEVSALLPAMLGAAKLLYQAYPDKSFILPFANERLMQCHAPQVQAANLPITITLGQSGEAMASACLSIVASGTAALEAMIYGSVMVVVYKVQWLSYAMFSMLKHIDHFSLPNQLLDTPEIPELSQKEVTAENIFRAADRFLQNPAHMQALQVQFERITASLHTNTDQLAARAVLDLLQTESHETK